MVEYEVLFSPEADEGLVNIFLFVWDVSGSEQVARQYTMAIVDYCKGFSTFPYRSIRRDDLRHGMHLTNYQGRIRIAYSISEEEKIVDILIIEPTRADYASHLYPGS